MGEHHYPGPVPARRRTPRQSLRAGATLLLLLVGASLLAPLIATDLPWLARGENGLLFSPALRGWLGLPGPRPAEYDPVVAAPIPHDPAAVSLDEKLQPPSLDHWLGTDGLGRDLGARVLHGARVSLAVGLLAAAFALVLGLPLGALAGYRGGWVDAVISRLIEAILCFPVLLLALAILAMSPEWLGRVPDVVRIALVLGIAGWIPVARYLRGEFLRLRDSDMAIAARASGAGHVRLVIRHILPSSLAPVLVTAAFTVGAAILLEAALSFIGLGVRPPTPTWGGLLTEARLHVDRAWWLAIFPGIALFLAVLGCNLLGEGIRDRLDPRVGGHR